MSLELVGRLVDEFNVQLCAGVLLAEVDGRATYIGGLKDGVWDIDQAWLDKLSAKKGKKKAADAAPEPVAVADLDFNLE